MVWRKGGLIFKPSGNNEFLKTHASNPTVVPLTGSIVRVYYNGRDSSNRSSIGAFEFDLSTQEVVHVTETPLFTYGDEGSFYSHGLSLGGTYSKENKRYLLFMGWRLIEGGHWKGSIGRLRIDAEDESLKIDPKEVFFSSSGIDSISVSYPWVIVEDGLIKMWYGSTVRWSSENGEMVHPIHYSTTRDGLSWIRHGESVPCELGVAQAFSRPCVIKKGNLFRMWYSFRSGGKSKYRIGYAESEDGLSWKRRHDIVGIDVSPSGWDSEMICYPFVLKWDGKWIMLYNGNDYGRTGIGIAYAT